MSKQASELFAQEWFGHGCRKQIKGDFRGAIADYNEAIRLDPNLISAYNNREIACDKLKDVGILE